MGGAHAYTLPLMPDLLFFTYDKPRKFWDHVFETALKIKTGSFEFQTKLHHKENIGKNVGLLFFEPSSRTRWSFERACQTLGVRYMSSVVDGSTSFSKGEKHKDTFKLYEQLGFDLIVMRSAEDEELYNVVQSLKTTQFINAGYGKKAHPTQAFLDYFTWCTEAPQYAKGAKILLLGDIKHSRVARSHFRFAKIMGYEVGVFSFPEMGLSEVEIKEFGCRVFTKREEALRWAQIVMPLRAQKERHKEGFAAEVFPLRESEIHEEQYIMHPGPFMRGKDLEDKLVEAPNSLIFKQVENGVYCRAALLNKMLSKE